MAAVADTSLEHAFNFIDRDEVPARARPPTHLCSHRLIRAQLYVRVVR